MLKGGSQGDATGATVQAEAELGRVVQRENARFTSEKSQVRSLPRPPDPGWVYFIRCPRLSLVKIGWSLRPDSRLHNLRTCFPYPLDLVTARRGSRQVERETHARFAHLREMSEWFRDENPLTNYVRIVLSNAGPRPWPEPEPETEEEKAAERAFFQELNAMTYQKPTRGRKPYWVK